MNESMNELMTKVGIELLGQLKTKILLKSCNFQFLNIVQKVATLLVICVDPGFGQSSLLAFVAFNKKQSFQTLHLLVVFLNRKTGSHPDVFLYIEK